MGGDGRKEGELLGDIRGQGRREVTEKILRG